MNNITAWTGLTINDILRKIKDRNERRAAIYSVQSTLRSRKTERRRRHDGGLVNLHLPDYIPDQTAVPYVWNRLPGY